jgi:hypothetical protein
MLPYSAKHSPFSWEEQEAVYELARMAVASLHACTSAAILVVGTMLKLARVVMTVLTHVCYSVTLPLFMHCTIYAVEREFVNGLPTRLHLCRTSSIFIHL